MIDRIASELVRQLVLSIMKEQRFMPIEKIMPKKTYLKIVDQIKEMINSGEYGIGNRLPPERELANKFGVSRPTVREALSALEILGIIDIQVGSGGYVKAIPERQISTNQLQVDFSPTELLEARLPVEGAMAALAAIKASGDAISEMKKIYFELVKDVRENNYQPDKDRMLHLKIAESTKNIHFIEIIKYFNHQMDNKIWQNFSEQIPNRTERMISNHWNIIKAIEDRDPDKKLRHDGNAHKYRVLKLFFRHDL